MNNYGSEYGVENKEDGVEFYFEIDTIEEKQRDYLLFFSFYDKIQQENRNKGEKNVFKETRNARV